MAINQDNKIRAIINGGELTAPDEYTFNLTQEQTIITGITNVKVDLGTVANNMSVIIETVFDNIKQSYANGTSWLVINDVVFDNFVDGGAGLPAEQSIDFGADSAEYFQNYVSTQTIEIVEPSV